MKNVYWIAPAFKVEAILFINSGLQFALALIDLKGFRMKKKVKIRTYVQWRCIFDFTEANAFVYYRDS